MKIFRVEYDGRTAVVVRCSRVRYSVRLFSSGKLSRTEQVIGKARAFNLALNMVGVTL